MRNIRIEPAHLSQKLDGSRRIALRPLGHAKLSVNHDSAPVEHMQ